MSQAITGKGTERRVWQRLRRYQLAAYAGIFLSFEKCDALRRELSWTHYRLLLRVESQRARQWYMHEAATQGWSTRALERQIGTLYYERLLSSQDRAPVEQEAAIHIQALGKTPREFVRDPVLLEFLGVPSAASLLENDLEQALPGSS